MKSRSEQPDLSSKAPAAVARRELESAGGRTSTLTRDMSDAGAPVGAEDFKQLLSRHGLNLIAEKVEDEKTVIQLLDCGVDYAQGYLFGEPRAVREDSLKAVSALEPATVIPLRRAG